MEFRRRAKLFERNSFLEKIRNRNKPKTDPNCGVMTIKQKDSISKYWNTYYKELFSPDNNGLKVN